MNVCVCVTPHNGNNTSFQHVTQKNKTKVQSTASESQAKWLIAQELFTLFLWILFTFFFCLRSGSLCGSMETVQDDAERKSSQHGFQRCILSLQTVRTRQEKKKTVAENHSGGFRLLVWSLFLAKRSAGSPEIREQVSAALMEVFQELRWILLHRVLTAAC